MNKKTIYTKPGGYRYEVVVGSEGEIRETFYSENVEDFSETTFLPLGLTVEAYLEELHSQLTEDGYTKS
jgi:hypothetical protein